MSIQVCFFSTVDRPYVHNYIKSLKKYDWKYYWIGKSIDNHKKYQEINSSLRTIITLNFLKSRKNNEYFILTDGFEVLANNGSSKFLNIFDSFESPIVMASFKEKSLINSSIKHLPNSSFVVGKVSDLIEVLEDCLENNISDYSQCWKKAFDDKKAVLDIHSKLFQLMENYKENLEDNIKNPYFIKYFNSKNYSTLNFLKKDFTVNNYNTRAENILEEDFSSDSSTSDSFNNNLQITILILVCIILVILILFLFYGFYMFYQDYKMKDKSDKKIKRFFEYSGFTNQITSIKTPETTNTMNFPLI